ncbi:MAG: DUF3343 domain-containing protein [Defluviitaleaceae bacterium]|nr:DUF3343 domain-containing protein [Defluviitaleaceae bacterium]
MKYIATFYSQYDAIVFLKVLKDKNINAKAMPTPRKLSASCGICVVFDNQPNSDYNDYEVDAVYIEENGKYTAIFQN